MCFLPLCHIAERMGGEYFALYTGSMLNFVENPETVPENVREIAPTVFTRGAAHLGEVLFGRDDPLREADRLQQLAYSLAIGVGYKVADACAAAQPVPAAISQPRSGSRACWRSTTCARLIGIHRARLLVTGAAPISPDLVRWYLALGVPMVEVWGMTESCGIATTKPAGRIKPGSIGPPLPHTEVKLVAGTARCWCAARPSSWAT